MIDTPMLILGTLSIVFIVILLIMSIGKPGESKSVSNPIEPNEEDLYQEYLKNKFLYRTDSALNFLQEYIWIAMKNDRSVENYEALKLEHESKFVELGGKFPVHPY